jgi:hypothetical protein
VYPNRVALMRNGVLETLYFPTPESMPANMAQNTPPTNTANTDTANTNVMDVPDGMSPFEIKRAAILQRLEELRANTQR